MWSERRKSSRRIESFEDVLRNERSPIIVDDAGSVMTHIFTYPYIVPIYYNYGKYDLNNLNKDFHRTSTTTEPPSWDRLGQVILPGSFYDNLNSKINLKTSKHYASLKDASVHDLDKSDEEDNQNHNYDRQLIDNEGKKITMDYLKAYFDHMS